MHSPGVSSHAKIITTATGLQDLLGDLAGETAIGLDTEFMRERTYRAELCLLQLTTRSGPMCIDPLALPDLSPLAAVLGAAGPPVVLHAGRQDLEVLAPTLGSMAPLFDTQIAAALCGHPSQVGYAELVRRLLGHEVPKGQTRTDWSRRPLSIEQIEYALDDVRHLLPRLKPASLARVSLLFPDPWPKSRHAKRRFISTSMLDRLAEVLIDGGEFRVASDHPTYIEWTLVHAPRHPAFLWEAQNPGDWRLRPADSTATRYEEKAIAAGRTPVFLNFSRRPRGG